MRAAEKERWGDGGGVQPGASSGDLAPLGWILLGVVGSHGSLAVDPAPQPPQPQQIKPGGCGGREPRPGVQAP